MSIGYADRLSFREDLGGRLGAPELSDAPHAALDKAVALADLVKAAGRVVAYTGAGISTACGIPDFRGPNGVWTAQRKGLEMPKAKVSFLYAQPSLTHMALLGLMQAGKLQYICSQNVDSLHLRAGVPRSQLAELHGNCFAERCRKCRAEYVRDFEMDTVGFKPTGRVCSQGGCRAPLVDHILDWEDALPPAELKATEQHGSAADLAICLGTSLQIIPAANLPLRTVKAGGALAIVNLQATPKDRAAQLVIHAKVDQVMAVVTQRTGVPIPSYVRTDRVQLSHKAAALAGEQQQQQQQGAASIPPTSSPLSSSRSWSFELTIASVHGSECPLPMVASAHVEFYGRLPCAAAPAADAGVAGVPADAGAVGAAEAPAQEAAAAATAPVPPPHVSLQGLQRVLPAQQCSGQLPWVVQRTHCPGGLEEVVAVVSLQLVDAADEGRRNPQVHYTMSRPEGLTAAAAAAAASTGGRSSGRASRSASAKQRQQQQQPDRVEVASFVTQVRDYSSEQQQLVSELEQAAAASRAAAPAGAASNGGGGAAYDDYNEDGTDDDDEALGSGGDGTGSDDDFVPPGGRAAAARAGGSSKKRRRQASG